MRGPGKREATKCWLSNERGRVGGPVTKETTSRPLGNNNRSFRGPGMRKVTLHCLRFERRPWCG